MKVNWELVDQFQERFGWDEAFEKARHFMVAYVSLIRRQLPPLATKAWTIARAFREGTATAEERTKIIAAMWDYINMREGNTASPDPDCCLMRATMWLLRDDNLGSGRKQSVISEEMHWFLFFANKFEDHSDCAPALIEQYFSSEKHTA